MDHLTATRYKGLINRVISVFTPATYPSPHFLYFHHIVPAAQKDAPTFISVHIHLVSLFASERFTHTHTHMTDAVQGVTMNRNELVSVLPLAYNHTH